LTKWKFSDIICNEIKVVYAVIAFLFKDKDNLFIAGKYWVYTALSFPYSKYHNRCYYSANYQEYKRNNNA